MAKRRARPRRQATEARRADRHALYQKSVQDPHHDIALVDRIFRKETGRRPLSLREDFCGTAFISSQWVAGHPERTATGVDIDRKTLDWGIAHNLAPLGEAADRVTLLEEDVRARRPGKFDLVLAFNYSYFVFETRDEMRGYFEEVRRSLEPDGLFVLDLYGGPESQEEREETRRVGRLTYVWEQRSVNPIDMSVVNHIHFRFRDGSEMTRAFTYEWRLWSCPELRELLEEAGFAWVDFYFEDEDADGENTGVFRRRVRVPNDPAWVAYIVAGRAPRGRRR